LQHHLDQELIVTNTVLVYYLVVQGNLDEAISVWEQLQETIRAQGDLTMPSPLMLTVRSKCFLSSRLVL